MTNDRRAGSTDRLSQRTASSALWNGAGSAAVQLISVFTYLVLASTLGPTTFGTVAMALAVVALPRLLADLGFAPAIVTGRLSEASAVATAHWAVVCWGLGWAALLWATAPLASSFFADASVLPVLRLAALLPVFDCAAALPQAVLQRDHRFDRVVKIDMSCQLGTAIGAIGMALLGYGVWAMLVPQAFGRALRALWLGGICPVRLRSHFAPRRLRAHLPESVHVVGAGTTTYLYRHADDLIVGRFFGAADLGLYTLAYDTLARSLTILSRAAAMPMLASLGALRADPRRFDAAVVRAARALARITLPFTLGAALVAPRAVEVLLGSEWSGAASLLRCFLCVAALQSIGALTGPIWLALGRHRLLFWWGVGTSALATSAFLTGAIWGGSVEWVAISFALITGCITSPAAYQATRRICGLELEGLLPGLSLVLLDTLAMLGVVASVGGALGDAATASATLTAQVVSGVLCYALLLRTLRRRELAELIALLPSIARPGAQLVFRMRVQSPAAADPTDQTLPGMIHQRPPTRRH